VAYPAGQGKEMADDVETLNLYIRNIEQPGRFKVEVGDPARPSNVIDFLSSDELQAALVQLHDRGKNRLKDIPSQDKVTSFIGETLYKSFITNGTPNPISDRVDSFLQRESPQRIAVHLPRSLYYLPWEVLRNPADPYGNFVSLFHSLVRVDGEAGGPDPRDIRFPPFDPTVDFLFVVASPGDCPIGDIEPGDIKDIRFSRVIPATYSNFQAFTSKRDIQPDGFIFLGHGDVAENYGRLLFVKQQGLIIKTTVSDPHPGYTVGSDLAQRRKLRLGCLLACDTAWVSDKMPFENSVVGAILIRSRVPFVLGNQARLSLDAAQAFLSALVENLQRRTPLDFAIKEGRRAIYALAGQNPYASLDWWVPVLYSKTLNFNVMREQAPPPIPVATRSF
jgi:hypothetical protein